MTWQLGRFSHVFYWTLFVSNVQLDLKCGCNLVMIRYLIRLRNFCFISLGTSQLNFQAENNHPLHESLIWIHCYRISQWDMAVNLILCYFCTRFPRTLDKTTFIACNVLKFYGLWQWNWYSSFNFLFYFIFFCGLQLPKEPHRSTSLLQLTGRW